MDTPPSADHATTEPELARMLDHRVHPDRIRAIQQASEELHDRLGPHSVRSALLIIVAFLLVLEVAGRALGQTSDAAEVAQKALMCALLVVLLVRLGWWRRVGLVPPAKWRDVRLFWISVAWLTVLFVVGLPYRGDFDLLLVNVPLAILVGFWEEGLFRGFLLLVLLSLALRKGASPIGPVLVTAVLFGAAHLINLSDGRPCATFAQVAYATFTGIALGGLLLRTNALWLAAAAHALFNAKSGLTLPPTSDLSAMEAVLLAFTELPAALFGLLLLRPKRFEVRLPWRNSANLGELPNR